jgi:serine/threonine-protein kinase RsbW
MTEPPGLTLESAALARPACADVLPVMCRRRVFPGAAEQGSQARGFVRSLLSGHPLLDDIVVVAAELFSNAVRHSRSALPGGLVLVEIRRWRRGVALTVVDQGGPSEPVMRPVDEGAESGRGLVVVDAYATWWRWRGDAQGRTITVFFWE